MAFNNSSFITIIKKCWKCISSYILQASAAPGKHLGTWVVPKGLTWICVCRTGTLYSIPLTGTSFVRSGKNSHGNQWAFYVMTTGYDPLLMDRTF